MRLPADLDDQLRIQTLILLDLIEPALLKRLVSLAVMMGLCWLAGKRAEVWWITAAALYTEVGLAIVTRQIPERVRAGLEGHMAAPLSPILTFWFNNLISLMIYSLSSVMLADQPSVQLFLCGLVWSFGLLVHMANTFNVAPLYSASHLVPAYSMVALTIWTARGQDFVAGPDWQWLLVVGMLLFFGINTAQIRMEQRAVVAALRTARAEAQVRLDRLEHLADHDPLTGLLNRRAFDDWLDRAISRGGATAFLLDLDGFKPINDSYSHAAGDAALIAVAERLRAAAGEDAKIARLGGDEFAVALDTAQPGGRLEWIADTMLTEIARPIPFGEGEILLTASIGVADSRRAPGSIEALLGAADQAMYRAKSSGGDRCCRYEPGTFPARATLKDRARLIAAMESGEIVAHYQPKVRLDDGRILGFEALARWVPRDGPPRGPGAFLPQIVELGLTGEFTARIARQVVRDVSHLLAQGLDPGQVSINLPEVSLTSLSGRKDILRVLDIDKTVTPHLTLEITEDVFIGRSSDVVRASMAAMRARGARISLDDFGTGFASFQNLRQLDYDELKIDRSFVSGLCGDPSAEVLIRGFLDIARGLGVDVVAEGIESSDQRDRLIALGCAYGQGYLYGAAMPLAETEIRLFASTASRVAAPAGDIPDLAHGPDRPGRPRASALRP